MKCGNIKYFKKRINNNSLNYIHLEERKDSKRALKKKNNKKFSNKLL